MLTPAPEIVTTCLSSSRLDALQIYSAAYVQESPAACRLISWAALTKLPAVGTFVAPAMIRLDHVADLKREIFGPVLHVATWKGGELDALIDAINASGYGLTLGVHTRIDSVAAHVAARAQGDRKRTRLNSSQ